MFSFKAALPQDSGASQKWNFENSEVEKRTGNPGKGHFPPTRSFPSFSGPARQGRSRLPTSRRARAPRPPPRPPARRSHAALSQPSLGGLAPKCPPLPSWALRSTARSSETVNASLLPPRLVTRELLNPPGVYTVSLPSQAEHLSRKNYDKVSINFAVANAVVSAAVSTHLPAHGRRYTCPGAHTAWESATGQLLRAH